MSTNRQLAAIVFTDIVGYSAMMQRNELLASRMRKRHREVLKTTHEKYGGQVLQYLGDGTLSIFSSSVAAVECTVEMQLEFRKDPEVPLRIGIHSGDVTYDDEGAYGDSVNIAARIENYCVAGGIFISEKVYDDIKNHPWLTAYSLGMFQLRNIFKPMEIFAVTSKGMVLPSRNELLDMPVSTPMVETETHYEHGGKNKWVASILAFFFGLFGVHRLYLGRRVSGIIWMILAISALIVTIEDGEPAVAVFGLLGFVEFILLLAMPKREFDRKYNRAKVKASAKDRPPIDKEVRRRRPDYERDVRRVRPAYELPRREVSRERGVSRRQRKPVQDPVKVRALKLFREGHYLEAVDFFEQVLETNYNDVPTHFNLACCHSLLENADDCFFHLSKAVEYGFSDMDKIKTHDALAFIRTHSKYEQFVQNGYKILKELPEPTENLLDQVPQYNLDKLSDLEKLGDKLEKGELTQEEFEKQKKEILKR